MAGGRVNVGKKGKDWAGKALGHALCGPGARERNARQAWPAARGKEATSPSCCMPPQTSTSLASPSRSSTEKNGKSRTAALSFRLPSFGPAVVGARHGARAGKGVEVDQRGVAFAMQAGRRRPAVGSGGGTTPEPTAASPPRAPESSAWPRERAWPPVRAACTSAPCRWWSAGTLPRTRCTWESCARRSGPGRNP